MEALLTWPAAPGATGYAIEVNWSPTVPNGTWVRAQATGSTESRSPSQEEDDEK
jgi:hypothetical protein